MQRAGSDLQRSAAAANTLPNNTLPPEQKPSAFAASGSQNATTTLSSPQDAIRIHNSPEALAVYTTVLRAVTSRITCSTTATRLNLHNGILDSRQNEAIKDAIRQYNTSGRTTPARTFFAEYRATNKLEAVITDAVISGLEQYYAQLSTHSSIYRSLPAESSDAEKMLFYLQEAIPQGTSPCQPLANLVAIHLMACDALSDELKSQVRMGIIGTGATAHTFVVICNKNDRVVIDPWIRYVTATNTHEHHSSDYGFCGSISEYTKLFNTLADDYALPKYNHNYSETAPLFGAAYVRDQMSPELKQQLLA